MSLVVHGRHVEMPNVRVVSWLDDPKVAPKVTDGKARTIAPTGIVLHTSRGQRGGVRSGSRPSNRAETLALYQSRTERQVSWHLTVDTDGDVLQQADVASWMCWHASHANGWTLGVEMVQHPDTGDLWQTQVDATVAVVEVLCREIQIPRRVPVDAKGNPFVGPVHAWQEKSEGGAQGSWQGVLGHRHLTTNRGPGDPGDGIFRALLAAGFEGVDVTALARRP
jgi:hypothetical protein